MSLRIHDYVEAEPCMIGAQQRSYIMWQGGGAPKQLRFVIPFLVTLF